MQDHTIPASGVKQNRLIGHTQLVIKYGSKHFRKKEKSLENVVFSRLFAVLLTNQWWR